MSDCNDLYELFIQSTYMYSRCYGVSNANEDMQEKENYENCKFFRRQIKK